MGNLQGFVVEDWQEEAPSYVRLSFDEINDAASGQWEQIIPKLTRLSADVFSRSTTDHPCPYCDGDSVVWPAKDASDTGKIVCRNCTNNLPPGDGIGTIAAFEGITNGEAARRVAEHLKLSNEPSKPRDPIVALCDAKRMPIEAFRQFEPTIAQRNGETVVRIRTYDATGEATGYFDLTPAGKGKNAPNQPAGMFFPSRLPQAGEQWILVEGVKDAAALIGLGHLAAGTPGESMPARFAHLFSGVSITIIHDLDTPGMKGASVTASRLIGFASDVRIARMDGEIKANKGNDVRDVFKGLSQEARVEVINKALRLAKPFSPAGSDSQEPTTSSASSLLDSFMAKLRSGIGDVVYDAGDTFAGFEAGPGKICVIGAPPGAGKTALVMQYVFAAIKHDAKLNAYIANAEMSFDVLLRRELTRRSGVAANAIRFAELKPDELKRVETAARDLASLMPQIEIVNGPYTTDCLQGLQDVTPGLLVVDYLQKFGSGDDARMATNAVVTCLRELARAGWGIIALSATTRQSGLGHDSQRLTMASFKESGEIEFNADSAYLIRDNGLDSGQSWRAVVTLDCVKNRHGELKPLEMIFDKQRMSFESGVNVSGLEPKEDRKPWRTAQ